MRDRRETGHPDSPRDAPANMMAGISSSALALVETATEGGYEGPDLTWYLLTCVLVIGGILGLGYVFRRLLARTVQARAAKRSLQVLDVLPLGGKQKLVVVRCYDRSFLLGLGEKEVRPVAELDTEETLAPPPPSRVEPETVPAARTLAGFDDLLRRSLPGARKASSASAPRPPAPRRPVLEEGRGILG